MRAYGPGVGGHCAGEVEERVPLRNTVLAALHLERRDEGRIRQIRKSTVWRLCSNAYVRRQKATTIQPSMKLSKQGLQTAARKELPVCGAKGAACRCTAGTPDRAQREGPAPVAAPEKSRSAQEGRWIRPPAAAHRSCPPPRAPPPGTPARKSPPSRAAEPAPTSAPTNTRARRHSPGQRRLESQSAPHTRRSHTSHRISAAGSPPLSSGCGPPDPGLGGRGQDPSANRSRQSWQASEADIEQGPKTLVQL